ncbi:MAG: DUF4124 domain-containing protein [Myxococcota bacterium]
MRLCLLISACLVLGAAAASAEYYTWVDDAGVRHYSDNFAQVPEAYRHRVETRDPDPSRAKKAGKRSAKRRSRSEAGAETFSAGLGGSDEGESSGFPWKLVLAGGGGLVGLIVLGAVWNARNGGIDLDEGDADESPAATLIGLILTFAFLNGILWCFGNWGAPRIWSDPSDRGCQEEGYWYARGSGEDELCESWYLIPLPRFRR